jgi:hypothetical protein
MVKGDIIQEVNGNPTAGINPGGFVEFLRTQPDNSKLIIKRGTTIVSISIVKEEISSFMNKCVSGDCLNGKGIYNTPYWSYEGEFKAGKRNGNGTTSWVNTGDVHTGAYINDAREGFGKMTQTIGYVYEGGFSYDAYHGKGKLTYPNGDVYSGNFNKDWPDGPGKMEYKNGDVYEGGFDNYQKTGKGKYKFKNGDVYEGDFINDQLTGKGRMVYANGNIYNGDFVNGNTQGNGIFLFSGNKADGLFENNRFIRGKLTNKSGVIADGEFGANGVFKKGTVYYTDGTIATGEFNGENNPVAGKVRYTKPGTNNKSSGSVIKTDDNFCREIKTMIAHSYTNFRDIKGSVSGQSNRVYNATYTLADAKTTNIIEFDKYTSIEFLLCNNISRPGDNNLFLFNCKKDYLIILRNCLAAESFTEIKEAGTDNTGFLNTGKEYKFKNKDNVWVKYALYLEGVFINIRKE